MSRFWGSLVFSCLMAVAAVFGAGGVACAEEALQPQVEVSPMNIDFGTVDEGVKSKAVFTIKNTGKAELDIIDVRPTCGCTVANLSSKKIAPGGQATLEAVYDSHNANGPVRRYINVRTNDPKAQTLSLGISASVTPKPAPDITMSMYNISNLQLAAGKSDTREIKIKSSGQLDLVISEVTTSPGASAVMDKQAFGPGQTTKFSLTMKPGEEKVLSITISPKKDSGFFQEILTIRSNAKRMPAATFVAQGMVQG